MNGAGKGGGGGPSLPPSLSGLGTVSCRCSARRFLLPFNNAASLQRKTRNQPFIIPRAAAVGPHLVPLLEEECHRAAAGLGAGTLCDAQG